jgi:hypothetical protein
LVTSKLADRRSQREVDVNEDITLVPIKFRPTRKWPIMEIIMVCAVSLASTAQAMVYKWSDSAGIVHYTNKEYEIPARYKARARAVYPEAGDSGQIQSNNTNGQQTPVTQSQPAIGLQPGVAAQQQPAVNQQVKPVTPTQPIAAEPQIKNSTSRATSRRERKQRDRSGDEE